MINEIENIICTNFIIFYSRSSWHLALSFLKLHFDPRIYRSFQIGFGYDRGEHITVRLCYLEENYTQASDFFMKLELFLERNLSIKLTADQRNEESFFIDFQNNSYIVLEPVLRKEHVGREFIGQSISNSLMSFFGDDEIDLEYIYTFVFYLHLGIARAFFPSIQDAAEGYFSLMDNLTITINQSDESEVNMQSHPLENIETIRSVYIEEGMVSLKDLNILWEDELLNTDWNWIIDWIGCCKRSLALYGTHLSAFHLTQSLYEQIGLSPDGKLHKLSVNILYRTLKTL